MPRACSGDMYAAVPRIRPAAVPVCASVGDCDRLMVQTDPHPIAQFRVIGPVSNMPEFAQAFACKADAPLVRPPEKRCEVW